MNDGIDRILEKGFLHGRVIANIPFDKDIAWAKVHSCQILEISGVRQDIKVDDAIRVVLLQHISYEIAADESCTARNEDVLHAINRV